MFSRCSGGLAFVRAVAGLADLHEAGVDPVLDQVR